MKMHRKALHRHSQFVQEVAINRPFAYHNDNDKKPVCVIEFQFEDGATNALVTNLEEMKMLRMRVNAAIYDMEGGRIEDVKPEDLDRWRNG